MRYQRKLQTLFVPLCLLIILCIGFSIAKDYSNLTLDELMTAASRTSQAMELFRDEDELTKVRNRITQLEADLRLQTEHYVLAGARRLSLENQIKPYQQLYDAASSAYNEALTDIIIAQIHIGVANIRMAEAEKGMKAALKEGNSENYRYWFGVYKNWQQHKEDAEADEKDAQTRSDAAYTDMIRLWIVLEPLKKKLQVHNTFSYDPLEAERNMMKSELSTLNARVTELETYYRNLELTAQAIQNEINKRKKKKPSGN
ncbi:MAG: hypothetical protein OXM61_23915 [Candidatus Poribacteria bacterium]|nr:hypothetical protein [Candidatus Poribacteria bacterium]